MRLLAQRFAVVVMVLACGQVARAQTAEEIIEKSIAAMGGRAALGKIKTSVMTGTITLTTPGGDIPGTIEIYNAVPNKVRTVIKADLSAFGAGPLTVDQRFDGTNGYVLDTLQGNRDITGNQLDNMRNNAFPHLFLAYKELGQNVRLGAREKVSDRDAHVLIFEPTAGSVMKQYVDVETLLPARLVVTVNIPQIGQDVEQVVEPSDFRDVGGMKVPHTLRLTSSVQSFTVNIAKVEANVALDEKMFSKP
jgi:hypothetical protein